MRGSFGSQKFHRTALSKSASQLSFTDRIDEVLRKHSIENFEHHEGSSQNETTYESYDPHRFRQRMDSMESMDSQELNANKQKPHVEKGRLRALDRLSPSQFLPKPSSAATERGSMPADPANATRSSSTGHSRHSATMHREFQHYRGKYLVPTVPPAAVQIP